MRNILPHTDLSNPEKYNDMISFRNIIKEDTLRLNQEYGCIKDLFGFKVFLRLTGIFELEDNYGNIIYIAKENVKEKVFDLIDSLDFQLCTSLEEFNLKIKSFFNRKIK